LVQKLKHIQGMSATNLRLFRTFYTNYPQINERVSKQFKIQQTVSVTLLLVPIKQLLNSCSFSHFTRSHTSKASGIWNLYKNSIYYETSCFAIGSDTL